MEKLFFIVNSLISLISCQHENALLKETKNGKVEGVTLKAYNGKEINAWLGIPYAEKPLGNLRFKRPQPINSWHDKILQTTSLPNSCVQIIQDLNVKDASTNNPNTQISEDCLYLNIFTPKSYQNNTTVMLWIHGGGFYSGTSTLDSYDPKTLVSEENIIVVSIQYRVASLGFLYLNTEDAPGNMGLYDQLLALQWVHQNIESFGGDPTQITLFGQSAGASSVSFHLLSPMSKNYFHQAIMQSGSATSGFAFITTEEALRRSLFLANEVDCPSDKNNVSSIINCLQNKNASELVKKEWNLDLKACNFPFAAINDGKIIVEDPQKSLEKQNFKKTNILLGSNPEEGYRFLIDLLPNVDNFTITRNQFLKFVDKASPFNDSVANEAIIFEYTDWNSPDDFVKNLDALDKIVSDFYFSCPVNEFGDAYSNGNHSVYKYFFNHRSSQHLWPAWMGVIHSDEIKYIFGKPISASQKYTLKETELSKQMMRYWANFARTGNPNSNGRNTWPLYSIKKREHLILNVETPKIQYGHRLRQCVFLRKYLPALISTIESLKSSNGNA